MESTWHIAVSPAGYPQTHACAFIVSAQAITLGTITGYIDPTAAVAATAVIPLLGNLLGFASVTELVMSQGNRCFLHAWNKAQN
jgi:hypothetical protein